ncbi:CPBP family intramembrane glutamic endopeptidase [Microbacterium sp. G2-8]|uniref:CPBP family intramembrane glutamic endopeptidase n=1 Tax=Microbacterium sp. G2-8 TaxID=2842454 RepID=UPI001C88E993|nr:CPBP family intramembrane glutamic endopeptidase [Microbacterium sp. G2-8]
MNTAPNLTYAPIGSLPDWAPRFLTVAGIALLAVVVAVCLPFWASDLDSAILSSATPALQWIPFVVILVVHATLRPGMRFWRWSAIGVRPLGRTLRTTGIALCVFVGVPLATIAVTASLGLVDYTVIDGAGTAALLVIPLSIVWMLFTFGEELGWRGYVQSTLAPLGFWRSSAIIGAFWAVWHLPLTLTYALEGTMPARDVVSTTVNLLLAAFAISAVRYLSGSVWPAVYAHAIMNMMGQFAYGNLVTPLVDLGDAAYWAFFAVSWTVWILVILLLGQAVRRRERT